MMLGSSRIEVPEHSQEQTMTETQLESRVITLEQQMRDVIQKIQSASPQNTGSRDWRKSLGMFDDHPLMKQIDEDGQRIRQENREQGAA
jgi:hypothetical protein